MGVEGDQEIVQMIVTEEHVMAAFGSQFGGASEGPNIHPNSGTSDKISAIIYKSGLHCL